MNDTIYDKFNEIKNNEESICTEQELEELMMSGLIFKTGDSYITRDMKPVNIRINKPKQFNLDFRNLIAICEEKVSDKDVKRVYCMDSRCYNKYKEEGLIIKRGEDEYYRLFDKELWLVYVHE